MGTISVRDIVFVSFPFSNLVNSKLRPAVVLAYAQKDDWILCQITSKSYADTKAIELSDSAFKTGSLNLISYVRPAKIFTANKEIIKKKVGTLKLEVQFKIVQAIKKILDDGK